VTYQTAEAPGARARYPNPSRASLGEDRADQDGGSCPSRTWRAAAVAPLRRPGPAPRAGRLATDARTSSAADRSGGGPGRPFPLWGRVSPAMGSAVHTLDEPASPGFMACCGDEVIPLGFEAPGSRTRPLSRRASTLRAPSRPRPHHRRSCSGPSTPPRRVSPGSACTCSPPWRIALLLRPACAGTSIAQPNADRKVDHARSTT
jgi:hypothetical protein